MVESSFIEITRYAFSGVVFFFFKQKTAYEMRISDWSSDVCSSDLSARYELCSANHENAAPAVLVVAIVWGRQGIGSQPVPIDRSRVHPRAPAMASGAWVTSVASASNGAVTL